MLPLNDSSKLNDSFQRLHEAASYSDPGSAKRPGNASDHHTQTTRADMRASAWAQAKGLIELAGPPHLDFNSSERSSWSGPAPGGRFTKSSLSYPASDTMSWASSMSRTSDEVDAWTRLVAKVEAVLQSRLRRIFRAWAAATQRELQLRDKALLACEMSLMFCLILSWHSLRMHTQLSMDNAIQLARRHRCRWHFGRWLHAISSAAQQVRERAVFARLDRGRQRRALWAWSLAHRRRQIVDQAQTVVRAHQLANPDAVNMLIIPSLLSYFEAETRGEQQMPVSALDLTAHSRARSSLRKLSGVVADARSGQTGAGADERRAFAHGSSTFCSCKEGGLSSGSFGCDSIIGPGSTGRRRTRSWWWGGGALRCAGSRSGRGSCHAGGTGRAVVLVGGSRASNFSSGVDSAGLAST